MMRHVLSIGALAFALVAAGCGKDDGKDDKPVPKAGTPSEAPTKATRPVQPAGDSLAEARKVFLQRCATCHGEKGRGDGPAAAPLTPKPRNYSDKEWQAKVTDDQIRTAITKGGQAIGLSPIMPAQTDLADKPEIVDGLVKLIRSFAAE